MNTPRALSDWIRWATDVLRPASDTPRLDAEILMAYARNCPRHQIYYRSALTSPQASLFENCVARRRRHEPVALITGVKSFYEHDFYVNESTIVPRFDTETLVDHALAFARARAGFVKSVLDVGLGGGAILLSLMSALSSASASLTGVGVEPSPDARALAHLNARRILAPSALARLRLYSNMNELGNERFQIVVSNPPYLRERDWTAAPMDVRVFEPKEALVADRSWEAWMRVLMPYVAPSGRLFLEWGYVSPQDDVPPVVSAHGARLISLVPCGDLCHFLIIERENYAS